MRIGIIRPGLKGLPALMIHTIVLFAVLAVVLRGQVKPEFPTLKLPDMEPVKKGRL